MIWRPSLRKGFLALTVALSLRMMPWAFRNKRDMGKYTPAGILTGTNLYRGNYYPTQGAYFLSTDSLLTDEIRTEIAQVTEVHRDSTLQSEAIKVITSHKTETAVQALKKFPRLWLNVGYGWKPSNRSLAIAAVVRFVFPLIPLVLAYSSYGSVSMIKRD